MMELDFALNPDLDTTCLAQTFARDRRVTIDAVLKPAVAVALHAMLRRREDWKQVINSGDKVVELDRQTLANMSSEERSALDTAVYAGSRKGFQYRYETLRVPDEDHLRADSEDPLWRFAQWWSNGPPMELLRAITGSRAIRFADMQATAYSPGDFLTGHDDAVAGKNRVAAYVLGLTPNWHVEWGGLLLFHGKQAQQLVALPPSFNRLNLFLVPQAHSVSEVTRSTPYRRYSLTGWLRR